MRVRQLDANGDMTFGRSSLNYYINDRRGVGQVVSTRLRLWLGQWYLNVPDGTPYMTQVLGKYTDNLRDAAVQARIYGAPGVTQIQAYNSELDRQSRDWTVNASIDTIYGSFKLAGPY